jgi:integrase
VFGCKYLKRSVRHDLPPWSGWPEIMRLYSKAEDTRFPEESKLYFAVFFETGCRVSEGLRLRPEQFKWNERARAQGSPLLSFLNEIAYFSTSIPCYVNVI